MSGKGKLNLNDYEGKLFMKYLSGKDEKIFRELYDCLNPFLFNLIYSMVGNKTSAKDILQETWIAVIKYGEKYHPAKGKFINYVYKIAKNQAFHWWEQRKDYYPLIEALINNSDNPDKYSDNHELGYILRGAVNNLRNQYQQDVILLYYFGDLKINEIADILEAPQQNVKNWLKRGREKMEKELRKNQSIALFREYK